ncbi:hypothetical protein ACFV13_21245 [Streptomyces bauhiniae]|uniref:hypothetical protein n=1 Tax=Streptomyces bauhiniae TaxID=2340725 RepID=UPI0036864554
MRVGPRPAGAPAGAAGISVLVVHGQQTLSVHQVVAFGAERDQRGPAKRHSFPLGCLFLPAGGLQLPLCGDLF